MRPGSCRYRYLVRVGPDCAGGVHLATVACLGMGPYLRHGRIRRSALEPPTSDDSTRGVHAEWPKGRGEVTITANNCVATNRVCCSARRGAAIRTPLSHSTLLAN